jgi:hypothetical protein
MLRLSALGAVVLAVLLPLSPVAWGQTAPSPEAAPLGLQPRKLAPGVLTTIRPEPLAEETFSGPRPIIEIVNSSNFDDWTPNHSPKTSTIKDIAGRITFRRTIWHLEFSFKPVRMIYVDIPQPTGMMQRKLIWYMVYRIRNTGAHMSPMAAKTEFGHDMYGPGRQNYSTRFYPRFLFEAHKEKKAYMDRVIPIAVPAIQRREDPAIRLFNSVQISQIDIKVSTETADHSVWGVATWTDIDQRTDFFSIYVQGLTNAYKWIDPEGAWKDGDPPGTGRRYAVKTLQLNFWRPGDQYNPHEEEIRFGIPGKAPYQYVYR